LNKSLVFTLSYKWINLLYVLKQMPHAQYEKYIIPLAHWCNQTIAYDLDGGIIAIFDGISEEKE
jgi:hypothetical protein